MNKIVKWISNNKISLIIILFVFLICKCSSSITNSSNKKQINKLHKQIDSISNENKKCRDTIFFYKQQIESVNKINSFLNQNNQVLSNAVKPQLIKIIKDK